MPTVIKPYTIEELHGLAEQADAQATKHHTDYRYDLAATGRAEANGYRLRAIMLKLGITAAPSTPPWHAAQTGAHALCGTCGHRRAAHLVSDQRMPRCMAPDCKCPGYTPKEFIVVEKSAAMLPTTEMIQPALAELNSCRCGHEIGKHRVVNPYLIGRCEQAGCACLKYVSKAFIATDLLQSYLAPHLCPHCQQPFYFVKTRICKCGHTDSLHGTSGACAGCSCEGFEL